jgi:hypothetical protein
MKSGEYNFWICQECKEKPEFDYADFLKHIIEVHGINPKKDKLKVELLSHIDERKFYTSNYKITCKKKVFMEVIRMKRADDYLMTFVCEEEK